MFDEVELSQEERERFGWQVMIPGFGTEAQKALKGASALVTRVGGLGGPAALNLAMAGIGKLVLAHGDVVELFHMNRMILASYEAVGRRSPAAVAAERIRELNPTIELEVHEQHVSEDTVDGFVDDVDVVLDCPPTFEERHLLNDACVLLQTPMIESAVRGMEGYLTTIVPGVTPCLACLGFESREWKLPFPVLGAVPCAIGSLAGLEAIKVITGYGSTLEGTLLLFDGATTGTRHIKVRRDPECPVCRDVTPAKARPPVGDHTDGAAQTRKGARSA